MARKPGTNGRSSTLMATTLLMPDASVMPKLSKAKQAAKKQASAASGVFGDKFSKAQEKDHVDRRAANIAFGLDALDDKTLHVTYFHMMRYLDDMGVTDRATKQGELFERGGEETEETEQTGDDGKVTPIGKAARKVAEQAGADLG